MTVRGTRRGTTETPAPDPHRDPSLLPGPEHPHRLFAGDNLPLLRALPDASVDLAYLDPPFNTGRAQLRRVGST